MTRPDAVAPDGMAPPGTFVPWLDVSVRQIIVELALTGANHGMRAEARAILDALPLLVSDGSNRELLRVALLIALGDTRAASMHLNTLRAGCANATDIHDASAHDAGADVLARWIAETEAGHAASDASFPKTSPLISLK